MANHSIAGKTILWTFTDGPMANKSFQHMFALDGSVVWQMLGDDGSSKPSAEQKYEAASLSQDVTVVSYCGTSGYTLTCALDFGSGKLVAFASNEEGVTLQHGTFEVIDGGGKRARISEPSAPTESAETESRA